MTCDYDPHRPYYCQTHNRQWLDDTQDICEYQRMLTAENRMEEIRKWAEMTYGVPAVYGSYQFGYSSAMTDILTVLNGENNA